MYTGGNWPSTVALWGVDILTWKRCVGGPGTCDSDEAKQVCEIYNVLSP